MASDKKVKMARKSPEDKLLRKWVGFIPDLWAKIEEYRFENKFGTESRAIRQLVMAGLAAEEARKHATNDSIPSNARAAYAGLRVAAMDGGTLADYSRAVLVDVADLYQYQDGRMKPCRHAPSSACDEWNCLKDGCHRANALLNNFTVGEEALAASKAA